VHRAIKMQSLSQIVTTLPRNHSTLHAEIMTREIAK